MTRLWNEPSDFADEMVDGFARANRRWVRKVVGGVARSAPSPSAEVALVIGGGSGHYPAFGGLVGPGLAHGAAMGNLFASPSAHRVASVVRESEQGRGVLLCYGNYAGDVLHFTSAQEALRAEGIDCRTVVVTDDIFSASPEERHRRRGIAGDLAVFKAAGAAAAAGYELDDVERIARRANERTRSMGVAFSGCTLPGAEEPLFTVAEGRMAIGLGIHGEPGVEETDVPTAAELAQLLVRRLLDQPEIPEGVELAGARVVPILNGLGSVKAEELYVVYRSVAQLLEEAGIVPIDPQVGEFCTSFDMAGASLTLFWLDDELERLWLAPADSPAFRTGSIAATGSGTGMGTGTEPTVLVSTPALPPATAASKAAAERVVDVLAAVSEAVDAHADELGRIDAVAGDGDHGIGMSRGARAAAETAARLGAQGAGAGTALAGAGEAWSDSAGGTSGALWGVILAELGYAIADAEAPTAASVSAGVSAAARAVMDFGKARVGDKTMVDALVPFADTLAARVASGAGLAAAWSDAAAAASQAADGTAELLPAMGRARTHGDKALGVPDPGAVSLALITARVGELLRSWAMGARPNA